MFDEVFGLPVHALVLHAVVVLVPLAAVCVVALALVPRWRPPYGVPVALLTTAAVGAVPVAVASGKTLRDRLGYPAESFRHGLLGDDVIWFAVPMWVFTIALVVLTRRREAYAVRTAHHRVPAGRRDRGAGAVVTAVAVLAAVFAVLSAVQVVRAGDAGSRSVWEGRLQSTR